jgi:hypothetical protein
MDYIESLNPEVILKDRVIRNISLEKDSLQIGLQKGQDRYYQVYDNYLFLHKQDCCESVTIHSIEGDLISLLNEKIKDFRFESHKDESPDDFTKKVVKEEEYSSDSFTWTILTFKTETKEVKVRWLGVSNGYYSEDVDFQQVKNK